MAVPRSRIIDLMKVQCKIFSTTFNPEGLRTGNKILRQRLRGPSMAAYYPRRVISIKDVQNLFPDCETWDDREIYRQEHVELTKSRGKGPPKKIRTKEDSKKSGKKKK